MNYTHLTAKSDFFTRTLGATGLALVMSLSTGAVSAACNFDAPTGSCKLSAELTSSGLQISTDGASCATVDYQVNGAVRRMYIDKQTGVDSSVTSASSGVQVISCKSFSSQGPVGITPTRVSAPAIISGAAAMQTTEQVISTNLVATGSKMVQVNVPVYEKRVYVERQVPVEKIVYVDKPVYIEKRVPVEQKVYVERPVYIERQVPVEKKVIVRQEVPVDRPVYVPYYIKPQVDVRYNQVVQGLPAGFQGQVPGVIQGGVIQGGVIQGGMVQGGMAPQMIQGQAMGQFPAQYQGQYSGQYPVQPVGSVVYPTPLPQSGQ